MRHNRKINHLGRQSAHRKAMLANMASSLILHKRIETTVAKAKALKKYVEPLMTKSKEDTTHQRRVVFSYLKDKYAVTELFRVVAPKIADRPGGYTRILHTGFRLGDAAEMCIIELVDFNVEVHQLDDTHLSSITQTETGVKNASVTTGTIGNFGSYYAEQLGNSILIFQVAEHNTTLVGSVLFRFGHQGLNILFQSLCLCDSGLDSFVENQRTCHIGQHRLTVSALTAKVIDFSIVSHRLT